MKPSELRIGNWVFNKAHERKQIKEVYQDASVYDPIPLNHEWLDRFGFILENGEYSKNYKLDDQWFSLDIRKWYDGVYRMICNSGCTGSKLLYVHQLQNLYHALTGKEL